MNVEDIASQISVIFGIQHDWRDQISGVHVYLGSAKTLARGGSNSPFNSVLTRQHLCKKLPKSVNVLHHCRFFETQCRNLHRWLNLRMCSTEVDFVLDRETFFHQQDTFSSNFFFTIESLKLTKLEELFNAEKQTVKWSTVHFIFHNTIQYRRTAAMPWQLYWNQENESHKERRH